MSMETERLRLRRWHESDREPFAELNADPVVMEYFTSTRTRVESDDLIDRIEAHFDQTGFGLWAVDVVASSEFAGYVGLWPPNFDAHFIPAVEVGWRLARRFWGQGFAPEAARAAVADGFQRLELDEIVSFTSATNLKSRRVMEKIGMTRDPSDDFEHPNVPAGDPLKPHVLYRISPSTR